VRLHQDEPQMRARDVGGLPPCGGAPHRVDSLTSRYFMSSYRLKLDAGDERRTAPASSHERRAFSLPLESTTTNACARNSSVSHPLPKVAIIAIAAASITSVAAHPRERRTGGSTKSRSSALFVLSTMIMNMTGTATTPLITAL